MPQQPTKKQKKKILTKVLKGAEEEYAKRGTCYLCIYLVVELEPYWGRPIERYEIDEPVEELFPEFKWPRKRRRQRSGCAQGWWEGRQIAPRRRHIQEVFKILEQQET